ncbi:MAG: hypothetical protein O9340_14600 [Cyclobacteriaceae bacterium]|jgi:hypothetical protein|nr:hypothetical protein [Cyclobacteriaceae bacterium]
MGKSKQASPLKFYLAKYFFLLIGFMQWLLALVFFTQYQPNAKSQFATLIFFTIGGLCFVLYVFISTHLRRVALSKKKIVILEQAKKQKVDWEDVKSLRLIPFINIYKLKIKGKKKGIYFFPSKDIDPLINFISQQGNKIKSVKNI